MNQSESEERHGRGSLPRPSEMDQQFWGRVKDGWHLDGGGSLRKVMSAAADLGAKEAWP